MSLTQAFIFFKAAAILVAILAFSALSVTISILKATVSQLILCAKLLTIQPNLAFNAIKDTLMRQLSSNAFWMVLRLIFTVYLCMPLYAWDARMDMFW